MQMEEAGHASANTENFGTGPVGKVSNSSRGKVNLSSRESRESMIEAIHKSTDNPEKLVELLEELSEMGLGVDHETYILISKKIHLFTPEEIGALLISWPQGEQAELVAGSGITSLNSVAALAAQSLVGRPVSELEQVLKSLPEKSPGRSFIFESLADSERFSSLATLKELSSSPTFPADEIAGFGLGVLRRVMNVESDQRVLLVDQYLTEIPNRGIQKGAVSGFVQGEIRDGNADIEELGNWLLQLDPEVGFAGDLALARESVAQGKIDWASDYADELFSRAEIQRADEFIKTTGPEFAKKDPLSCATWAASLPEELSEARMFTLSVAIDTLLENDPGAAEQLATKFQDNDAFSSVYSSLLRIRKNQ